jgi:hypothetical protein
MQLSVNIMIHHFSRPIVSFSKSRFSPINCNVLSISREKIGVSKIDFFLIQDFFRVFFWFIFMQYLSYGRG